VLRRSSVAALVALLAVLASNVHAVTATYKNSTLRSARTAAISPNGAWTTYHHDDAHSGYDPLAPAATNIEVTTGWALNALDDNVYAEALVFNGVVYVATLNDTVYALNQTDGAIIWSRHVGTPQTSGWACGNVSPTGILGTPVIDTSANRLYAAAEVVINGSTTYRLFGLDLGNNGTIVLNTPILPAGFDWTIQQQRGALGLHGGNVYVPFGGRAGDCGPYHGWVIAVPTTGGPIVNYYLTPGTGAGFWTAGGVVIDDATGNVFESSGNGVASGCDANPDGTPTFENDAVVRLAAGSLVHQDSFIPQDWQVDWCNNDQDLGSASPVLISSSLMFQSGKWGTGFLLNPNNLGGMDGQLYPTPKPAAYVEANTCFGNHSDATFGSFAYAPPFVYLECEGHGIVALNVNTGTSSFSPCTTCASPDWNAGGTATFGPPIVAGGAVWAATDGGGLYAFNATTGAELFHSAGFNINRFVTPAEAGGQVLVPSGTVIRSFSFGGSVTVSPAHLDFGGIAPAASSPAQTVTLHNNTSGAVSVTSVAFTGSNAGDYVKNSDTCTGMSIAAGLTCTVQVSFSPLGFGGLPATLAFTDSGAGSPQAVALYGMGAVDNRSHLYTLDGWGGLHPDGGSPALATTAYWPGWNIARSLALLPDGSGGYVMDGWGGLHPFGAASPVAGYAYWSGWDIAREVVLAPWATKALPAGWTLDGWGGVHPFGGAPTISGFAYWSGWDIARGLVINPDSTPSATSGYTLDGWGGVHPFGGAKPVSNFAYWPGRDFARGIALSPDSSVTNPAGWTLDAYGGVHPFGNAPAVTTTAYWQGWDIARAVVSWSASGSGSGGWVMDGWGGLHPFGNAPAVSEGGYWSGWDIATSLGGNTSNSGSKRRT
jgi:PQQ-like domain